MEWSVEIAKAGTEAIEPVLFEPSDVYRLSQLGRDLPWLSGLDPYRDRQIRGEELQVARQDVEAAFTRYRLEFLAQYASAKGSSLDELHRRPDLLHGAAGKFQADHMYQLLRRAILLLEAAGNRKLTVNVYGT